MTGANPGEHGIFGFTDLDPQSYRLRFPAFGELAAPTLWDRLGDAGRRCCIINQPATYPARPVAGVLISGFVAPDLAKSVYPADLLRPLERMGYRVDVDTLKAQDELDRLLDDLDALLETRRRAMDYLWKQEAWDYFEVVLTGTDRLHHFLWDAVERPDDPRHERAMRYYCAVDALIGAAWDQFHRGRSPDNEGDGFLILSDHGFTALRQEVRLNAWLREHGYLSYRSAEPAGVADIAPESRAFALDPGRIYINLRGRFGRGCVKPEGAADLRTEIADRLRELTFEGEPVIARIFTNEEAYRGPKSSSGPDLVVLGRDGFDLKGTTRGHELFARTHFQGMHTWDDALLWCTLPMAENPEISDLAHVILNHLGV
jgi:predicted AlkP superfamily phosphohydrolase/phosphomutase